MGEWSKDRISDDEKVNEAWKKVWEKEKFDTAKKWYDAGWELASAAFDWSKSWGDDASTAKKWYDGIDNHWNDEKEGRSAKALDKAGWPGTPAEGAVWLYEANSLGVKMVCAAAEAGWKEPKTFRSWVDCGWKTPELIAKAWKWADAGWEGEDAIDWKFLNIEKPKTVKKIADKLMSAVGSKELSDIVDDVKKVGLTLEELKCWFKNPFPVQCRTPKEKLIYLKARLN